MNMHNQPADMGNIRIQLLLKIYTASKPKLCEKLGKLAGLSSLKQMLASNWVFSSDTRSKLRAVMSFTDGFLEATEDMFGIARTSEDAPFTYPFFNTKCDAKSGLRLKGFLRQSSLGGGLSEAQLLMKLAPDGIDSVDEAEDILAGKRSIAYMALQDVVKALQDDDMDVTVYKVLGIQPPPSTESIQNPASMASTAALKTVRRKKGSFVLPAADGVDEDKGEIVAPLPEPLPLPPVEETLAPVTVAEGDTSASAESADVVDVLDVGTTTVTLDVSAVESGAEVLPEPVAKDDTATTEAAQERDKALADAQAELVTLRQQLGDKQEQLQATITARDQALALAEETMQSLNASQKQMAGHAAAREQRIAELTRDIEAAVEAREEAMARATGFEGELHAMSTQVSELRRERAADAKALRKAEADAERSQTALDALRKAQAAVPARPAAVAKAKVPAAQPEAPKLRRCWAYAYPGGVPFRVKRAMKRQG